MPRLDTDFPGIKTFSTLIEIRPLHDDLGGCRITPNYTTKWSP